jgi:hypothetical protein
MDPAWQTGLSQSVPFLHLTKVNGNFTSTMVAPVFAPESNNGPNPSRITL